jgi:hypothetical protein
MSDSAPSQKQVNSDTDRMPCPRCDGSGVYSRAIVSNVGGRPAITRIDTGACAICDGTGEIQFPPIVEEAPSEVTPVATCRVCGCTDIDCSSCVERTGMACYWVEPDLCSACVRD